MTNNITKQVSTTNKFGFSNHVTDDGDEVLQVDVEISVPASFDEATEFFGGEEKTLDVLVNEVARRKVNAARPVLREADVELDWETVAQETAEGYTPGRRGGFQPVEADQLEGMDQSDIIDYLKSRGLAK